MPTLLERDDIQGLVVRGYKKHAVSRFTLIAFGSTPAEVAAAKRWLAGLAVKNGTSDRDVTYVNIAFTWRGLERLGCPPAVLSGFSDEFRAGMTTPHRRRVLGDTGESAPEKWSWGYGPNPVDAVLLAYARTTADLDLRCTALSAGFAACGIREVRTIDTCRLPGDREHFGFHDGIASPVIDGLGQYHVPSLNPAVKAGEFILGYENEYGRLTARPVVDRVLDPHSILKRDVEGSEGADFGRNGTYLVFRQLYQDVHGFWKFVDQAAGKMPGGRGRSWLAAKMVGRWQSGAPLVLAPDRDQPALGHEDQFLYRTPDALGIACPLGAHIRRTHPRDAFMLVDAEESVALSNRHRLLRRGRSYGPPLVESMAPDDILTRGPDGRDRGLCFICLTANISRQFEFVQSSWMNNPTFNGLQNDVDPLLGNRKPFTAGGAPQQVGDTFTIPDLPVRTRVRGLPNFVTVRGGAYFFMPGIAALQYLARC